MDGVVDSGVGDDMALVCVEPTSPTSNQRAEELAKLWNVPVSSEFKGGSGVKVVVSELAVGLGFADRKRGKPYYVDFLSQAWRTRLTKGLPKSHIFRRALGFRDRPLRIIDATAGFGQDAVLALSLGCEVIAVEKSNVVVTVLRNGVMRALREDETVHAVFEKLSVVEADAEIFLQQVDPADVVYLDPMFIKPKKSAKSPKEMQLLQDLLAPLPTADDLERLFSVAYERARQRVVVKQPLKAKALGRTPTHTYKGQSIRYDVYVKNASTKTPNLV
jgi:16S rRNA (guanine1516-N2)-methyltransferase